MKYERILFDLDGTLTDSGPGIINCASYALEKMGLTPPPPQELRFFIGPPLTDSFRSFGMNEEDIWKAIGFYRERYRPIGIFENEVYEGIFEALQHLKNAGIKLYVATSKPLGMAVTVLEHFHLLDLFDDVAGAAEDGSLSRKEDILSHLLLKLDLSPEERHRVCMVGDRKYDMEGAAALGLDGLGVYWGYADPGELETAGAFKTFRLVSEMEEFFLAP